MSAWEECKLSLNCGDGIKERDGIKKDGLGIFKLLRGYWRIMHINTGLSIFDIRGDIKFTKSIADEILSLAPWSDIVGIDSWKNIDRDLPEKLKAILRRERLRVIYPRSENNRDISAKNAVVIAEKVGV